VYEKRSSPNEEDCNNMKRSSFIEENTLLQFSLTGQMANSRLGADKVLKKIKTVGSIYRCMAVQHIYFHMMDQVLAFI